jgi:hypothetical protein
MRIVFHAGFHKTGTTSLQQALVAHQAALAEVAHVETRALSPRFAAAADAARALALSDTAGAAKALRQSLADWACGLPDLTAKALLASSEDFAGHMPGRHGLPDYRAVQQVMPAVVAALRARFGQARITLLYTTRAAEPWLRSLHWQLSKHPDLRLKQRRFCKDYAGAADFAAVLTPLRRALAGQAEVAEVALETSGTRRLGPVAALYDLAGLPAALCDGLPVAPQANVSPPVDLADQFITLNRRGLPPTELRRIKRDMTSLMLGLYADGP